jgi:hypothetical protein
MAAPITHLVISEKIFNKYIKEKNKKEFFIGTLFPDIRYLSEIDREITHFDSLDFNVLKKEESFTAGLKLHSMLDRARQKFIVSNDIYSFCPESKYPAQSLKLLEDKIFYQYVDDWREYINYLEDILPEEKKFGINNEDIKKWHQLLQKYFSSQPDHSAVRFLSGNLGFTESDADEINKTMDKMCRSSNIVNSAKNMYKNIDKYLL